VAFWKSAGVTHLTAHTTFNSGHHTRIAAAPRPITSPPSPRYRAAVADLL
jgi:hypothetical protein